MHSVLCWYPAMPAPWCGLELLLPGESVSEHLYHLKAPSHMLCLPGSNCRTLPTKHNEHVISCQWPSHSKTCHALRISANVELGIVVQASDLVDIFVGSASSADAGPAAKQSLVEQLLDSQVPLPSPSSFFHCQHTGLVHATPRNSLSAANCALALRSC